WRAITSPWSPPSNSGPPPAPRGRRRAPSGAETTRMGISHEGWGGLAFLLLRGEDFMANRHTLSTHPDRVRERIDASREEIAESLLALRERLRIRHDW